MTSAGGELNGRTNSFLTQSCAESGVQSAEAEDTCTALFSWKQSQKEAISSLPVATQHSSCQALSPSWLTAMVPLLTFLLLSSWLFDHFFPLVRWLILCTTGEKIPYDIHLLALRSRNTSAAFKPRFGWFLLHLKPSRSSKGASYISPLPL